jgi:hypothetical protein
VDTAFNKMIYIFHRGKNFKTPRVVLSKYTLGFSILKIKDNELLIETEQDSCMSRELQKIVAKKDIYWVLAQN